MILLQEVSKTYYLGDKPVPVLDRLSLHVPRGQFIAIMGPSGSGKSTLLNIIGCLDVVDSGTYTLSDIPVSMASESSLAAVRNRHLGFVFQSFNLIPRISALRNVELPMIYAGIPADVRRNRAKAALDIVGLADRASHSAAMLSGGQQQRVAIARSIVNDPEVIIADEPTGALDVNTSIEVMNLFRQLSASGKTIVMVTHEPEIAAFAQRIVTVQHGRVFEASASLPKTDEDALASDIQQF